MALLFALKEMLLDKNVSADGRDNAISLIAKNVPRKDLRYGTNARTMTFTEIGGKFVLLFMLYKLQVLCLFRTH